MAVDHSGTVLTVLVYRSKVSKPHCMSGDCVCQTSTNYKRIKDDALLGNMTALQVGAAICISICYVILILHLVLTQSAHHMSEVFR